MNTTVMPISTRASALRLIELLQQAHFLARGLEDYTRVDREHRLADRIHAARVLAEQLR
jgi:hypothetical protein